VIFVIASSSSESGKIISFSLLELLRDNEEIALFAQKTLNILFRVLLNTIYLYSKVLYFIVQIGVLEVGRGVLTVVIFWYFPPNPLSLYADF